MNLCVITNYQNKGYINEIITFNKIIDSLNISPNDIYNFISPNIAYGINKTYTHALIFMDYRVSSIEFYRQFFNEVEIPKIFVIDTIPQHNKELNEDFIKIYIQGMINSFNGLPVNQQLFLYENYADGFVFLNDNDVNLFQQYYNLKTPKPFSVIPPPLGSKDQIKLNLDNMTPNKNIGVNGYPSNQSGSFDLMRLLKFKPNYNLNMYGTHGREDILNEMIVNHMTSTNDRIKFNGRLKNDEKFFKNNYIYANFSIYDTFDYYTFFSLLNGSVPLISKTSSTSSFFKLYPFIVDGNIDSMSNALDVIDRTSLDDMKDILKTSFEDIRELNNQNSYEQYKKFLNSI